MLTTKHLPEMQQKRSQTEQKMKPACVVDYIGNMAGVDKSDQMISYLPLHRKTVKWWKKLFLHLLTLVMIQAHRLYNKNEKKNGRKTVRLKNFVMSVWKELANLKADSSCDELEPGPSGDTEAAVPTGADINRLRPGNHWPAELPSKEGQKRKPPKACVVCYARMAAQGAMRQEL